MEFCAVLLFFCLSSVHTVPHTHAEQCRKDVTFISFRFSTVQCGPSKRGHLLSLKDFTTFIWGAAPFLIISRHTKRWAPNNTEQIPLCAQVLNVSAATVCPPPLLLLFRYLHVSERCGAHKRYPQLSFYLFFERQAHFKAFICAKPLINSAHAASLGLPSLKCWVL